MGLLEVPVLCFSKLVCMTMFQDVSSVFRILHSVLLFSVMLVDLWKNLKKIFFDIMMIFIS